MFSKEKYQGEIENGRYGIIETIGGGSFADVHLARDFKLKRLVAIKILRDSLANAAPWEETPLSPQVAREARLEERFFEEAQRIASLPQPNRHHVIEVYDSGRTEKGNTAFPKLVRPYMVMQFASKGSLHQQIEGKIYTPEQALTYLTPIAHALDFVYEQGGIIHMDAKPGNVLINEDGTLLLADFGLVSFANRGKPASLPVGTPPYSAPERYMRGYIAHRSADVFALGVIAFELLCGVLPHSTNNIIDYMDFYRTTGYTLPTFRSRNKKVNVSTQVEKVSERR